MLFQTVYGKELEEIFNFIKSREENEQSTTTEDIANSFTYGNINKSIKDALDFLKSAYLLYNRGDFFYTNSEFDFFSLSLLYKLNFIKKEILKPRHNLDPYYLLVLEHIFIDRDMLFIADLVTEVNKNSKFKNLCLNDEKLGAWKRVMEFLGVGRRGMGGFLVHYSLDLVEKILLLWNLRRGTAKEFFEDHIVNFLPCFHKQGDLSRAIKYPLSILEKEGKIAFSYKQDLPTKSYWDDRKINYIEVFLNEK
jgi:hypothetical protein